MESAKVYRLATYSLLALNLLLVAALIVGRPGAPREGINAPPSLNLNDRQAADFQVLATTHKEEMRQLTTAQGEALRTYFSGLSDPDGAPDTLPTAVLDLERRRIEQTYRHFEEVRQLLEPEQQPGFPEFVDRALDRILLKPGAPPQR